jgi:hypothetical protein
MIKTTITCDQCGRYLNDKPYEMDYMTLSRFRNIGLSTDDNGPWHFCDLDCLQDWSLLKPRT